MRGNRFKTPLTRPSHNSSSIICLEHITRPLRKQSHDRSWTILIFPSSGYLLQTSVVNPYFFPSPAAAAPSFLAKATVVSASSFFRPARGLLPRGWLTLALPFSHTFGLFLAHYSRLLLFGALEFGARLLKAPWPCQSLLPGKRNATGRAFNGAWIEID